MKPLFLGGLRVVWLISHEKCEEVSFRGVSWFTKKNQEFGNPLLIIMFNLYVISIYKLQVSQISAGHVPCSGPKAPKTRGPTGGPAKQV